MSRSHMRESDIEAILVREVKALGGRAYKWVSPGNSGVPDRVVVLPHGRVWFVELKTDTGQLTALQRKQIGTLQKCEANVFVLKGVTGLVKFFQTVGEDDTAAKIWNKYT